MPTKDNFKSFYDFLYLIPESIGMFTSANSFIELTLDVTYSLKRYKGI